MKKFILKIVRQIVRIYPCSINLRLNNVKNIIYTQWIKSEFKSFGEGSYIERKIRLVGGENIEIGSHVDIRSHSIISTWSLYRKYKYFPTLIIGDNSSIGEYSNISSVCKIVLGKNVLLGRWVTIIDHAHGEFIVEHLNISPKERPLYFKGPILIDDDVWIGDKVTICSGVHIHKGAVIGANSVVTADIPAYSLAVGTPARVIKSLK